MDADRFSVRPFAPADLEAEARLDELSDPGYATTAEMIRHWEEVGDAAPGHVRMKLAVDDRTSGRVVAVAGFEHTSFNFHPHRYQVDVSVDPAVRHLGIGSELYDRVERAVRARGAEALWASVRADDPEGIRFYERRGFRTLRETWRSRLDLPTARLDRFSDRSEELARRGVRLTTLAEEGADRPEVRRRLFTLSAAASADVPRLGSYSPVSYEQFVKIELENPHTIREAYFLAADGDRYVGLTVLEHDPRHADTLWVGFTATHPDFRGRGIASTLKVRAVRYGVDHGFRYLLTLNDSLNHPIWSINERLGFRPVVTWRMGEKTLAAPGPTA